MNHGEFYALPQSPQLFKQILMVSGCDRYFQIVKCFRDEDLRADRQPEFTQVDLEMSFITETDIISLLEGYVKGLFAEILSEQVVTPFLQLTWKEAMETYGSDKPDLRIPMSICNLDPVFDKADFEPFRKIMAEGGTVRGLRVPGGAAFSRKDLSDLEERAKGLGAKGLAAFQVKAGELKGPLVKTLDEGGRQVLCEASGLCDGDALFVAAGEWVSTCSMLGTLRLEIASRLDLVDRSAWAFLWVRDSLSWNGTKKTGAGAPCTTPSRPLTRKTFTCSKRTRERSVPGRTTSCSTGAKSGEVPSGYTIPLCRRKFSGSSPSPPSRLGKGSGSSSKP